MIRQTSLSCACRSWRDVVKPRRNWFLRTRYARYTPHHHHGRVAGEGRRVVTPPTFLPYLSINLGPAVILYLEFCISMLSNLYIARPTYHFFLIYTCGLTVVIKRMCYVMLCHVRGRQHASNTKSKWSKLTQKQTKIRTKPFTEKNIETNLILTKYKFKNWSYLCAYRCAQVSYRTQHGTVLTVW